MRTYSFATDWRVSVLGENAFKTVELPHDAMRYEARVDDAPSGTHGAYFIGNDYEYVKTFLVENGFETERHFLHFEGAYRFAEVYLNGVLLTKHDYGFTHFDVELIGLKAGENELRVVTRNADQPNCRWYAGAGLYRPVTWITLPKTSLDMYGVKISTTDYATRTAELLCTGNGTGKVAFTVMDGKTALYRGEAELGKKTLFTVKQAELWDLENPKVYTLCVRYGDDEREIVFGFRQIEITRENGCLLNGKRVIIRGACIHSDNGLLGAEAHPFADERKIRLLKSVGYNAIRSAHNPCSEATLTACDKWGMLVLDEYTDGWYVHKTRYDYATHIENNWKDDFACMVEKDYNHPCVFAYSIGNEVAETSQEKGIRLTQDMTEYLHTLDCTRLVTCGVNVFFNYLFALGFGVYNDKKAEKGEKVGSEFFNMLAGAFGDKTMKLGATLGGVDRKTKDAFSKMDIAGYNYGILRYKKDLKKYPNRIILGTETFCKDAYRFYELAKTHTGVIGDFVWAGMDYLGEVAIGSWEYGSYADDFRAVNGWISAGSGRMDLTGKPLGEALYTRVAFGLDVIRMAVVPVDDYGKRHSPSAWKLSNAIESWVWDGLEGKKTCVEIYARAYAVALYENGKRIVKKRVKNGCLTKCKIRFFQGELKAVALDKKGNVLGETKLHSAVGTVRLVAEAETPVIQKNGLAYIRLRFADEKGQTAPLTRGKITVTTDGELLALGHACPYNKDEYLQNTTGTYYGEALAIVKPKRQDTISFTAESEYGTAKIDMKVE